MGDLMHALPALTDASKEFPGIEFDWVVDEAFADIPKWHPAVKNVIPSAHRRWKKNVTQSARSGQLSNFYRQLNQHDYDVVLDAQNNLKSAFISTLRRGKAHGLDKDSIREKPAHWAYKYRYSNDKSQHAIARQRQLFAQAIGYPLPNTEPDFGIDRTRLELPDIDLPQHFLFFVHNASWTTKLWPESHWLSLIDQSVKAGYNVVLPSGSDEELERAQRFAANYSNVLALPKLSLSQVAAVMDKAVGAVCCDTGLCHLAGILDLPTVSFYGPTNAQLVGSTGRNQHHVIASQTEFPCAPCYKRQCSFNTELKDMASCMESFTPESVWNQLTSLIANCSK